MSGTLLGAAIIAGCTAPASAGDLKIRSPIIDTHELELETNATIGRGKNIVSELEYGFTNWLKLGLEGELAAEPGHGFRYDAAAVEGYFQLTPQGKYWADLALFAEYEHTARRGDPRSITIGPLVRKETPLFAEIYALQTVNVLFTKQVGEGSSGAPSVFVAAQSRARLDPYFEPGIGYLWQFRPERARRAGGAPVGSGIRRTHRVSRIGDRGSGRHQIRRRLSARPQRGYRSEHGPGPVESGSRCKRRRNAAAIAASERHADAAIYRQGRAEHFGPAIVQHNRQSDIFYRFRVEIGPEQSISLIEQIVHQGEIAAPVR